MVPSEFINIMELLFKDSDEPIHPNEWFPHNLLILWGCSSKIVMKLLFKDTDEPIHPNEWFPQNLLILWSCSSKIPMNLFIPLSKIPLPFGMAIKKCVKYLDYIN